MGKIADLKPGKFLDMFLRNRKKLLESDSEITGMAVEVSADGAAALIFSDSADYIVMSGQNALDFAFSLATQVMRARPDLVKEQLEQITDMQKSMKTNKH